MRQEEQEHLARVGGEIDREVVALTSPVARRGRHVQDHEAWMSENLPQDGSNVVDTGQALDLYRQTVRSKHEAGSRLERLRQPPAVMH